MFCILGSYRPSPLHCAATFAPKFQPEAGPNSYGGSKPSHSSPSATAAKQFSWRPRNSCVPRGGLSKRQAHAPWSGPSWLPARHEGSLRLRSPATDLPTILRMPIRAGGSSKATRSATRAPRCIAGSTSQTERFLQHLGLRSSQACLRSADSSPARSAWLVTARASLFLLVG
jgi:hypothetical protein